jgi:hypothetical protein
MLKVYLSTVQPVLEYAVPMWQGIPHDLSDAMELNYLIYPETESYSEVLNFKDKKRTVVCKIY